MSDWLAIALLAVGFGVLVALWDVRAPLGWRPLSGHHWTVAPLTDDPTSTGT